MLQKLVLQKWEDLEAFHLEVQRPAQVSNKPGGPAKPGVAFGFG